MHRPDVDGMLAEMSSRDLAEWMAYSRIEPWGEERDDLRIGILASMIANMFREKGKKAYEPQDFILNFEPEDEEAKVQKMIESLRHTLGGKR
jgi:hypothetical protein